MPVIEQEIISAIFEERFGHIILSRLSWEWLASKENQLLLQEAQRYYTKFLEIPTRESLSEFIRVNSNLPEAHVKHVLDLVQSCPPVSSPQFLEYHLEHVLQGAALKTALMDAVSLYQDEKFEEIFQLFQKARATSTVKEKAIASFWESWDQRDETLRGDPMPTGFDTLDKILKGGIYPGETMLTIGLKSTGKTQFAAWIARAALFYNRCVVYFTMEISRAAFLQRVDSSIANFDFDQYAEHRDEIRDIIMSKRNELQGNVYVVEYPSGQPTVSMIENEILEIEQKIGRKVDGYIIDYIDLLRGTVVGADNTARFGLISAAVELRGICGKNNWAGVLLTQSNALGKRKPFIESENAAESYGKSWSSDFVVSINEVIGRPDLRRLYIADSRRTQKKISILYEVDFAKSIWKEAHGF